VTKVERLEQEIVKLSRSERTALRQWLESYLADQWDREIETDARSGRLDRLARQALEAHRAGRTKAL